MNETEPKKETRRKFEKCGCSYCTGKKSDLVLRGIIDGRKVKQKREGERG